MSQNDIKKEKKYVRVTISIDGELNKKVDDYCEANSMAKSKFIANLLKREIEKWIL